ncbi:flagellar assembly protein FliW [Nesterenkonia halotolerans]|uniref:Flagellar assembly factor FliW n=1 Tax=Nesterenkonia halotolerans TaxID=225325 RepID=A0ABR9J651_9MICC|nr:flagellar assembly protein FliW [Nesterenkonia halotolerans]MBE1514476.1 flagellar assembly factor FliW [Nesterenkonia halotolerans]
MSEIHFPASLPGLEPLKTFRLTAVEGSTGLYSLDSTELPDVRLFLLDPAVHLPGYSPRTQGQLSLLGDPAAEDVRVLVIVNTSDGAPHVNLLAPVVLDVLRAQGTQVILEGQDLPVRAALPQPAEMR